MPDAFTWDLVPLGSHERPHPVPPDLEELVVSLPEFLRPSEELLGQVVFQTPAQRFAGCVWAQANEALRGLILLLAPADESGRFRCPRVIVPLIARWATESHITLRWLELKPEDHAMRLFRSALAEGVAKGKYLKQTEIVAQIEATRAAVPWKCAPDLCQMATEASMQDAYARYRVLSGHTHPDAVTIQPAVMHPQGGDWGLWTRSFALDYSGAVRAAARIAGKPFEGDPGTAAPTPTA